MPSRKVFFILFFVFASVLQIHAEDFSYTVIKPENWVSYGHSGLYFYTNPQDSSSVIIQSFETNVKDFDEIDVGFIYGDDFFKKRNYEPLGEAFPKSNGLVNNIIYRKFKDGPFLGEVVLMYYPGKMFLVTGTAKESVYNEMEKVLDSFSVETTEDFSNEIFLKNIGFWGRSLIKLLILILPLVGLQFGRKFSQWRNSAWKDVKNRNWAIVYFAVLIITIFVIAFLLNCSPELMFKYMAFYIGLFAVFAIFATSRLMKGFIRGFVGF